MKTHGTADAGSEFLSNKTLISNIPLIAIFLFKRRKNMHKDAHVTIYILRDLTDRILYRPRILRRHPGYLVERVRVQGHASLAVLADGDVRTDDNEDIDQREAQSRHDPA